MIVTKEVEVIPTGSMIQYYKSKGYDAKYKIPLLVKISDLPNKSNKEIVVTCDYCNESYTTRYVNYYETTKAFTLKCACANCASKKQRDVFLQRYGVENISQLDSVKDKKKKTTFEHYGVYYPQQSLEVQQTMKANNLQKYGVECTLQDIKTKEKTKKTCLEKYGCEDATRSDFVINKRQQTMIERYGVASASQCLEFKDKMKETCLKNLGVDHPGKSPKVREKMAQTLYGLSSQKCSKQQLYIFDLYNKYENIEMNFPILYYNVDICVPQDKFIIEYDGGGHNLNVISGRETEQEHLRKEIARHNIIKHEGYKTMRIISSKDKLPSDAILLQMLSEAKQYFFDYPEHSWIEYNIDTSTVRNAEHKDGIYFDYGELRTIKRTQQND